MSFFDIIKRINRIIGQLIAKHEREVARRYARLLTEIRKELAKNYEKYEQDGKLTMQEMLKHDRLRKMEKRINHMLKVHYKDMYKDLNRAIGEVYKDGYYLTAHAVETYTKVKLGYSSVTPETLRAMLDNPIKGLTLNQRLEKNRAYITGQIQQQVTNGLKNNETYSTMARRLKVELGQDATKAMRVVRTEGHRVQESAKHDACEHATKNGVIMMKQWNTLEDQRVRKRPKSKADHAKLNNKMLPMDKLFDDGLSKGPAPGMMGAAGSDINCRCLLTYSIQKIERPQHQELEDMEFKEWERERLRD